MNSADGPPSGCPFQRAAREIAGIAHRNWQPLRPDGTQPRSFHDKTHACLRATFHVEPPADPALHRGFFATPRSYPALVRFSNSLSPNDWMPDPRGIAIKVHGVTGDVCEGSPPGQQEFVFASQPQFYFANTPALLPLFRSLDGGGPLAPSNFKSLGTALKFVFPGLRPRRWRWDYLRATRTTFANHFRCRDLLRLSYYSITPYQFGDNATKYEIHPDPLPAGRQPGRGRNLRERLQSALDRGPVSFGFYLQPRRGETDPLDDATRLWAGPTVRAGRLELPPQDVAATVALGDKLTFNPWHCLREHTPLGSINLARLHAYQISAASRGATAVFPPA